MFGVADQALGKAQAMQSNQSKSKAAGRQAVPMQQGESTLEGSKTFYQINNDIPSNFSPNLKSNYFDHEFSDSSKFYEEYNK